MPHRLLNRRSRLSLRLELTILFVVALVVVEGLVLSTYWFARSRPDVEDSSTRLEDALLALVPLVEQRPGSLWTLPELELLALRADIDVVSIVDATGQAVAGQEAVFSREAVQRVLREGRSTWEIAPLFEATSRTNGVESQAAAPDAPLQPDGGGDLEPPPRGPNAGALTERVIVLDEWPVVGNCVAFTDAVGDELFLIGASGADVDSPPAVFSAATWTAAIGILSATIAAWIVLGRALRPLAALAESARAISPERRDERLDIDGGQREIDEARQSLNEALDRLESGYDALDLFIGNVSHELRTPIATVLSEARQLEIRRRSAEEYERFVSSTGDEMSRLGKMIHSFLTLARMDWEERRGISERTSLCDVALDVVQLSTPLARQHDVRLILNLPEEELVEVDGDPDLLTSMVDNLVRNAIRFGPRGTQVQILLEGQGDRVSVRVRDEGPGIPVDLIDRIHEPFVQGETGQTSGRGSGIGLAIAQKVAELHGGRLCVRNHPDGGAEAVVELPRLVDEPA